jgi:hypothetical protein
MCEAVVAMTKWDHLGSRSATLVPLQGLTQTKIDYYHQLRAGFVPPPFPCIIAKHPKGTHPDYWGGEEVRWRHRGLDNRRTLIILYQVLFTIKAIT